MGGLQWKQRAKKFLVIVADAPCHGGKRFHDCADSFPNGGASGMPDPWLKKMCDDGVQLIFVRINSSTDKMVKEFRKIYELSGKTSNVMELIEVDLSSGDTSVFESAITEQVMGNIGCA